MSRSSNKVRRLVLSAVVGLSMIAPLHAADVASVEPDQMTQSALKLFEIGRLQGAIDAETEAMVHNPKDWLPVAMRSYFLWQQGCTQDAVTDGQKAVALNDKNVKVLTNLAIMHQTLAEFGPACELFEKAIKLAPNDWLPRIGQARCYLADGATETSVTLLKNMIGESGKSFEWYSRVGELFLSMNKNDLAEAAAAESISAAKTKEQRADGQMQLAMALLRQDKVAEAQPLKKTIFADPKLSDPELITRTASQLISSTDTFSAKKFLQQVQPNLKEVAGGDVLFRLGMIFEEKAGGLPPENVKAGEWLALAMNAYTQASEIVPFEAKYHSAIASLLCKQNNFVAAARELAKATEQDKTNRLLPLLVSNLESPTSGEKPLNLTEVRFTFNASSCGCKMSKIAAVLRGVEGVLYAGTKVNAGAMIIDQTAAAPEEILATCSKRLAVNNRQAQVKFEVQSRNPVTTTRQALKLAQEQSEVSPVFFTYELTPANPVMPIELASGNAKLSSNSKITR